MMHFYFLKRIVLSGFIFILLSLPRLQAQQLGLANSNFVGTHSLYTNPSAIADARQGFSLNLFSAEGNVTNNYFRYEGPVSLFKLFKEGRDIEEEYLKERQNGKPKLFVAGADFRGPSFMVRLSPQHSLAFTTRVRGGMNINNLSEDIARLYKLEGGQDGNAEELLDKFSDNNTINFNANVYSELGISYARVIFDKGTHFLKGGLTVKKLAGGYSAHLINEDTRFKVREEANDEYVLEVARIKTRYGYLDEDAVKNFENSSVADLLLGRNSPGKGWGADLGVTYEHRPNHEKYRKMLDGKEVIDQRKSKYKYRVGFSLMDVGGIKYTLADSVRGYDLEKNNKELRLSDFDEADNTEEYAQVINTAFGITDADKITSFRSGLPTALNLNFDYRIASKLYANATWIQGLRGKNAIGMRQNSLLAVTPRLELRALEASFPVALQNNYSVLTVGTMVKLGPLFIGSDNVGGLFNIGKPYGANAYAGLVFALAPKKLKDKDKDGVSDSRDKCKTVPGTLETFGCPDKDKDGVADKEDACPEVAGPVELKGCPAPANNSSSPAPSNLQTKPAGTAPGATPTKNNGAPATSPAKATEKKP